MQQKQRKRGMFLTEKTRFHVSLTLAAPASHHLPRLLRKPVKDNLTMAKLRVTNTGASRRRGTTQSLPFPMASSFSPSTCATGDQPDVFNSLSNKTPQVRPLNIQEDT